MSIFDKYMQNVDAKALEESAKEISEANSGNREEVPHGKYEVEVNKLEAKMSKSGRPMIVIWYKIVAGGHKGQFIFQNSVYDQDWMRHRIAKQLAKLMDSSALEATLNLVLKNPVETVNEAMMDLHESISGKLEYLLNYGESKGYNTYTIEDVYKLN